MCRTVIEMSDSESEKEKRKSVRELHYGETGKPLVDRTIERSRASREQGEGGKILKKVAQSKGGIEAVRDEKRTEEMEGGFIGSSPFSNRALKQQSYSTDAQAVETKVVRNPATQYLVLNSKDRNQTSSTGQYVRQAWNNFRLQRPQNIMQTYATRMLVSEINFPYYIPNVNPLNNKIWLRSGGVVYEIFIGTGFLTGTELAFIITTLMATGVSSSAGSIFPGAVAGNTITLGFNASTSVFTWISGDPIQLYFTDPGTALQPLSQVPYESQYYSTASLAQLMGFEFATVSGVVGVPGVGSFLSSNPTTLQYTKYIDIVSDKLHQHTTNRDGNSDNFFARNLLCRLYISDESSNIVQSFFVSGDALTTTSTPVQFIPGVNGSFIIHRQFKNPKSVMWNKEASVDWLDIALYDEYGNLLPLPTGVSTVPTPTLSYPDFQITLLASEN